MHLIIARGSRNGRLLGAISTYIDLSHRSIAIGSSYEYRYDRTLTQHENIIAAVVSGDAQKAVEHMKDHMVDVREYFKKRFLFD